VGDGHHSGKLEVLRHGEVEDVGGGQQEGLRNGELPGRWLDVKLEEATHSILQSEIIAGVKPGHSILGRKAVEVALQRGKVGGLVSNSAVARR
jgi:hypothetical protein